MKKIWHKKNGQENALSMWTETFTVGNDYLLDERLLPFDIEASVAHVKGLQLIGILTSDESKMLIEALYQLRNDHASGKFSIKKEHEDVHTAIEEYLITHLGNTGKKVHTGRSRNDQVLTALRLYEKQELDLIASQTMALVSGFINFAEEYEFVPMPGYTHTQPAMIASVGMWAASHAEMLISGVKLVKAVKELIDYCPLGTAAGFGVNLDLPRQGVSDLLGFKAPITVAMTAQSSRGRWEASLVHALTSISATLAQFASDLIMYTSKEYEFFEVNQGLTTGSSIMPQKKNQDVAEILRAKHHQIVSDEFLLQQLTMRLTSGYHRDLQLTKEPLFRSIDGCKEMIEATHMLLTNLVPVEENLKLGIYPEMMAADRANELVNKGMAFREAYQKAAMAPENGEIGVLEEVLKDRVHPGATGNLGLKKLRKEVTLLKKS